MEKEILDCLNSYGINSAEEKANQIFQYAETLFSTYKMHLRDKQKRKEYEKRPKGLGRLSGYLPLILKEYQEILNKTLEITKEEYNQSESEQLYEEFIDEFKIIYQFLEKLQDTHDHQPFKVKNAIYQFIINHESLHLTWQYHGKNLYKLSKEARITYIQEDKCEILSDFSNLLLSMNQEERPAIMNKSD